MSGRTIGGVLGAVVGAYFGNPQLGWMIGSTVGGIVDPDKIYGPRLTDAAQQTAQDGIPRTYGWGTFPTAGNIIWTDDLKEHKEEDDGKGGPVSVTYTYTRSYAIAVARGPITGYLIIKRNGKIVYDTRPDAVLTALGYTSRQIAETRAAQAKFEQTVTFYYGDDTQGADPTMTAVLGAGNVPKYRGTAYIVCTDDDVTELGGAIPQFEFVVSVCGTRTTQYTTDNILVTGSEKVDEGPVFSSSTASDDPTFVGLDPDTGADIAAAAASHFGGVWTAVSSSGARASTDDRATWDSVEIETGKSFDQIIGGANGWVAVENQAPGRVHVATTNPPTSFSVPLLTATSTSGSDASSAVRQCNIAFKIGSLYAIARAFQRDLFASSYPGGPYHAVWDSDAEIAAGRDPNGSSIIGWYDMAEHEGDWYAIIEWGFGQRKPLVIKNPNGYAQWATFDVVMDMGDSPTATPAQLCEGGGVLMVMMTDGSVYTSADGFTSPITTGLTSGADRRGGRKIAYSASSDLFYAISGDKVALIEPGATSVLSLETLPVSTSKTVSIGSTVSGEEIPDAPGYYVDPVTGIITGPGGTQVDRCIPTLGEIVADCCDSRGVTSRDVSELTDDVQGLRVASVSSAQATIAATMPAYFFDSSEYDGKIHFPKRGGAMTFAITTDDLVARDGDPIEWERVQEPELLRKVTVGYIDPDTTYTVRTQDWERRAGTIKAQGSSTLELPITGGKDWSKQVAEKTIKVAWAEGDKCKFSLSALEWATLVPAQVGYLTDEDNTVHRIRLTKLEVDGGTLLVEATKERNNTYTSSAVGNAGVKPKYPGSTLYGPTDGLLLNIPALSTDHDGPGLYWAASGFLGFQWRGATLQLNKGAGWTTAATTTRPSVLGTLTAELPDADRDYTDTANTLSVRVNGTLSSVTWEQMLNGANAAAILYADGTAEVVQWQTATQTGSGTYNLTTLQRGRLDTTTGDHASGARFALLDSSLTFVPLAAADLGATIGTRNVTAGTDADAAPTGSITLTTLESAREWSVANLAASRNDDDDVTVTWDGRPRFGSGVQPIQSSHFIGYRIEYSDGTTTITKTIARTPLVIVGGIVQTDETTTHTYTATEQTADFGSLPTSLDVTVYAVNDISGAGPGEEITV